MPRTYDPNTPEGRRVADHWERVYRREHPRPDQGWRSLGPVARDVVYAFAIIAVVFLCVAGVLYLNGGPLH